MKIIIQMQSIQIGSDCLVDLPYSFDDKLIDWLLENGGARKNGVFIREGNITGKLLASMLNTTIKHFQDEHQRLNNNYHRDKHDNDYRRACRDYLMEVEPENISIEDALEALGYGRNGLDFSY